MYKRQGLVDGVCALTHNAGCSQLGDDMLTTQKLLKGLINHPNAGAVLVVSLGCENNCLEYFKPVLGEVDPRRVKFLVTQDHEDEYEAGMELLDGLAEYAGSFRRQKLSAELLQIGLKCGSSDAVSYTHLGDWVYDAVPSVRRLHLSDRTGFPRGRRGDLPRILRSV